MSFYHLNSETSETQQEHPKIFEEPPDINLEPLFKSYPEKTLFSVQQSLENDGGLINLSDCASITVGEFKSLADKLLSLDREIYPLKTLNLNNCCVRNKEMAKLAPVILKFENVTLNGSQCLDLRGWDTLKEAICGMSVIPKSIKLKVLELKIQQKDKDVIKEGQNFLIGKQEKIIREGLHKGQQVELSAEEFDTLPMNGKSLEKIAEFLPKLEEVYLDNIFVDKPIFSKLVTKIGEGQQLLLKKRSTSNEERREKAWDTVAKKIKETPDSKRTLKCLSLNGCGINNKILKILIPALVKIRKIYLAENPEITEEGWERLADKVAEEGNQMSFLSLKVTNPKSQHMMKCTEGIMTQLIRVMIKMEEVDLSGQKYITRENWEILVDQLNVCGTKELKLKSLTLSKGNLDNDTLDRIKKINIPSLKVQFSDQESLLGKEVEKAVHKIINVQQIDSQLDNENEPPEDLIP